MMTLTVTLDWHDAYLAAVSLLLLLSFRLAFRARNIAATNETRSQRFMLWSGLLLFIGHGIFLVVGTMLSLEGFYIANIGFMAYGARAAISMRLALSRAARNGEPRRPLRVKLASRSGASNGTDPQWATR